MNCPIGLTTLLVTPTEACKQKLVPNNSILEMENMRELKLA
jgi:hypothetical protein